MPVLPKGPRGTFRVAMATTWFPCFSAGAVKAQICYTRRENTQVTTIITVAGEP